MFAINRGALAANTYEGAAHGPSTVSIILSTMFP